MSLHNAVTSKTRLTARLWLIFATHCLTHSVFPKLQRISIARECHHLNYMLAQSPPPPTTGKGKGWPYQKQYRGPVYIHWWMYDIVHVTQKWNHHFWDIGWVTLQYPNKNSIMVHFTSIIEFLSRDQNVIPNEITSRSHGCHTRLELLVDAFPFGFRQDR